ncbi:MAG: NAD(P)H-binding protein [Phocaeicola sp.]
MRAVIIGATGATGKELLELLLADKAVAEVVALVRTALTVEHPKLKSVVVDFAQLEKWSSEIKGDIAFSCLGTTLRTAGSQKAQYVVDYNYQYEFAKLAKANHIPSFVLISSSSASPKSVLFYSRMKGELEQSVAALEFKNFITFRPGPLIRPNTDRTGEKIGILIMGFFNSLGILKKMKPLPVKSLAQLMLHYAKKPLLGHIILEADQILLETKEF